VVHALGIDVGSSNAKVALIASDGTVVTAASRALVTHREGTTARQDAVALWDAVVDATRQVTAAAPDAAAGVGVVGVCSQYSSIVPVDAAGHPTGEMIPYLDHGGTDHSWAIIDRHPDAFAVWLERHGIPPVGGGLTLAHLLHAQIDHPDLHARTHAYLEPMDYVCARLTGRIAANQCTMFMSQLIDNRTAGVTSYDDDLVAMAGVDVDHLPELVPLHEPLGPLRRDVADTLGLPRGAVVVPGVNDSHAGAIGSGAYGPGRAGVMIGTTSVLLETTDGRRDTDLDHEVLSMPGPVGDRYLVWAENGLGGKALEHVLVEIVHAVDELADHGTLDHFGRLDHALAAVPAGSGGVLFLPWMAGSFSPDANPKMRGGFVNLSLDTRRSHLVRAVVEGICHNLAWLVPYVEAFSGAPVEQLTFGGGAARSAVWCQILADVLGRPVSVLDDPDHLNTRAVGRLGLHRLGVLEEAELLAPPLAAAPLEPDPDARAVHAAVHPQFVASFGALRPVYEALNG
jgi:xylulokinase